MRSHIFKLVLLFTILNLSVLSLSGQTTYTTATSGIWSDGSIWIGGVAPGPTDNAIIASGTTVTLFGSDATINDLTIETGAVVDAANRSLTVNGKLLVHGTYTSKDSDAKDLFFNGDTLGGTGIIKTDFANKDIIVSANAVIPSSSDLTVFGKISLGNDVTVTNKGKIEITENLNGSNSTTSIWTNSDDSYLVAGNTLMITGVLNASSPGNTVEYNGSGDQGITLPSASTYHNLKLRGAGNKNLPAAIVINGNMEIYNSAILQSNNYNIDIKGNWTNHSDFVQGTGRVSFTGTGEQFINNPMLETFYNFRIYKTSGELILQNDIIIENLLTMVAGVINTSGNTLTLGTGTATGDLGSLSYFGGFIRGKFERWINNTGSHHFPVGVSNAQRLLININGLSAGGTLLAEFIGSDTGNAGLPLYDIDTTIYNTFVEGYWTLDYSNGFNLGGGNDYNLQLYGTGFTSFPIDGDTRILTRTDAPADWQAEGSHLSGSGDMVRRNELTSLPAHYALGDDTEDCDKPATSAITGPVDVCAGQSGVAYSVTDNPPNTYNWTITGGVQASGGNTSSITVDWDATGTDNASVTVVESNACTNGAPVVLPVTVHSVPPESITGKTRVPQNSSGLSYSVPARAGYTYQWAVSGGTQVSGGNTNSITVDWGAAGTGNVSVIAELPGCPQATPVDLEVRIYDIIESIQTGSWDDPATWDCNCVPLETDNVRINAGHTVTLHNANDIEVNNFIVEQSGVLNYNTRPFVVHGDFIVDGTYQGGSDRVLSLDGTDNIIEGEGTVVGGFTIPAGNKTISSSSTLAINAGDITLGASVFVTNNGDMTLDGNLIGTDATSTWINSDNSILEITGELLATGALRAFAPGNLVEYSGAGQTVKTPFNSIYHDLTCNGSGIKTLSNSIVIEGDLLINGTSTLDVSANNYSINIAGDWTDNATFEARGGVVTFNGVTDQTITGAESYYNLVYLNTGGDLVLTDDVIVANNLQMAGRNIVTGSNIITIGTDAANIGSLTYVSGIVTGKMERWINSFGNNLFPVGVATSYNPAWLYINLFNSPGSVIVEFLPNDPGSSGLPLVDGTTTISSQFTDGYWNFTAANGFDVANYDLSLQASNFTSYPQNINTRILKRINNLDWTFDGNHVTAAPPVINRELLSTGISALGTQFGIAYACGPFTIDAVITEPSCNGFSDGAIDITPSDGASSYTFLWSPGGQTTEDISGLTAGNYTVDVTDALGCVTQETFNVSEPGEIVVDYLVTDVECAGDTDGAIDISVSGGTAPYTYTWSTTNGSGLSPNDEDQTGLTDGTYTVLIDDVNGCSITEDIVVSVVDPFPPVIICPGNLSAECDISEQPAYLTYADFTAAGGTATDNCDIDPGSFTMLSETSDGNSCPETVTRIYQIFDVNGNSETCTHIITVDDVTPPTASNPAPINVECPGDVPAPDISVVTDEADNCTAAPTVAFVSDVSDGNTCPETITRTYSVTDDCGNSINVTQTITVDDITPPTASNPASINVECPGDVPLPDITVVTDEADNCTAAPTVAFVSDVSDGNTCPETITRTYSVTDECGNSINLTQTITVNDITPPTASNPPSIDVECPGDIPAPDITVVTDEADNCTAAPTVAFVSDVSDGNTCPETITRTYSVSDECGNSINVTQTITVNDLTPPTASNPAPISVECPGDVPAPDITVVTDEADNCGSAPTVAFVSDVSDGNTCPETITRTYSVTDDCGNSINVTQTITINDTTAPVAVEAPGALDVTLDCADASGLNAALLMEPSFTDNCTAAGSLVVNLISDNTVADPVCPDAYVRTRSWTATDECGNTSASYVQTITVNDLIPPTASDPAPINVECSGDVPAPDISVVTDEADNCTAVPTVAFVSDVSDGNTCPETITRTYSVTDDCGNSINVTQIITVDDITPPTASNPAPIDVECPGDVPSPDITVVTDEADNCTALPTVAFVSDVSDGNTCPETITRTYSVTDDCGNSINVIQTITVNDLTSPTASNLAPVDVECPGDVPAPDITVVTDEADNCTASPTVAFVSDVSDGNTCPETITRTYSVTDECGNSINVTQTITVNDITPPTASNPAPINVECPGDVPAPDISVVTDEADNCSSAPTVSYIEDLSDGNTCPETITRTYLVADACGNSIIVAQTITVDDLTDPVISDCPADIIVPADPVTCEAVVNWTEPTATDNCNLASFTGSHTPGTTFGMGTTTVIYTATDDCGNTATCTFDVTVIDDQGPVITTCASDKTIPSDNNCEALVPDLTAEVIATDNCSPPIVISQSPAAGTVISTGTTTVILTATDGSGNSTDCFADLIVIDDIDPVLVSTDTTIYIGAGNIATIDSSFVWDATASYDNCGITSVTIDINTFDCSNLGANTVNITAFDAAGNSASGTATVTVSDTNTVIADAGEDDTCLEGGSYTLSDASVVNGTVLWGTTGDGVFDDPTLVNPTYTLGPTDADSVKLYMDVTPVIGCTPVSDTMTLTISKGALAEAGADDAVCASETSYNITDASSTGGTVLWTTSGDGSFDDATIDNPVYIFGTGDYSTGSVTLTMTVTSGGMGGEDSDDKIITINELPGIVVDEHSEISCNGLTDGVLRISGTGGASPYQYNINGGAYQASGEFTGLSAGDYDLSVLDNNGCQKDTTITIIEPDVFTFTLDNVTHNTCYGSDDASISITISGGAQPYAINWTGPDGFTSTEEDPVDLAAGLYSLNLTDANSCNVFTLDTLITEPPQIVVTTVDVSDYNGYGVTCYGATDGYIEVDISGGTGVLATNWEGPGGYTSSDEDISGLAAGDYTLTVTDERACSETYEVSLSEPDELMITYSVTDASCPDTEDGSIDITITGGAIPYTILWNDGVTVGDRNAVYSGYYTVQVTDANGCTAQETMSVNVIGINCLEVPEIITPGVVDGKNDYLIIRNISLYPNAEIKIFNRWGQLIYSAKNLDENHWDGTYRGKALPVDSYHYILNLGDGSTPRTGTITIIR
ncbi:MAG: gliding motility-associated C-terminal domain-containing protein [Bacteroidota bacterium]|nr:gliding motility-associated C-terminal domain-containing protein [Bacteroidota bacterium]